MPIYTKFGDRGETRLFNGTRVPKSNIRVAAYGNVDELNTVLGVAGAFINDASILSLLNDIQRHLLTLVLLWPIRTPKRQGRTSHV